MRGVLVDGVKLLAARQRSGLTQLELARVAGVDVKTIRKAERGGRIDLPPLTRLAKAVAIDVQLLIASEPADDDLQERRRTTIYDWARAFDAHDMPGLLALYHDDATLRLPGGPNVPFGGVFRGKELIRQAHEAAWSTTRQEPIRLDQMSLFIAERSITLRGEKGIYMPSGELVRFPCLQVFTFLEHLVSEHEVQFDTLDFARRMGQVS